VFGIDLGIIIGEAIAAIERWPSICPVPQQTKAGDGLSAVDEKRRLEKS